MTPPTGPRLGTQAHSIPGDVFHPCRRPHRTRSSWTSRYHQRDGHLTSVLYPADTVRTHLGHLKVVLREITLKFYQYLEKVIFKFLP